MTKAGGHLLLSHELIGQKPAEARVLYDGAADFLGWRSLEPVQEAVLDYTTLKGEPSGTLRGLTLSREFGDDAVYARLKAYAEENYEPTWDAESGEFSWGFGLDEWYPPRAIQRQHRGARGREPGGILAPVPRTEFEEVH